MYWNIGTSVGVSLSDSELNQYNARDSALSKSFTSDCTLAEQAEHEDTEQVTLVEPKETDQVTLFEREKTTDQRFCTGYCCES